MFKAIKKSIQRETIKVVVEQKRQDYLMKLQRLTPRQLPGEVFFSIALLMVFTYRVPGPALGSARCSTRPGLQMLPASNKTIRFTLFHNRGVTNSNDTVR